MMSKLTNMIEEQEGRSKTVYFDSLGYATIAVGCLVDARKGGGLRDEEIDFIRDNRIALVTNDVKQQFPWFVGLNEPRQAVLISMCYQMGLGGLLGFKKALAAMQDERWAEAEREMRDSQWFKQTPARAGRMGRQVFTGEWQ
jgi:lysozyme